GQRSESEQSGSCDSSGRETAGCHHGVFSFGASTPCSLSVLTFLVLKSTTRMRWALVSATYILSPAMEIPPGSLRRGPASQPSRSPPSSVVQDCLAGSTTFILLL